MPFYEYQCGECNHRLEVLQKISDEPLVFCPECNAAALKKLISAAVFRLKGNGWYETDFKNNDQKKKQSDNNIPNEAKSDGAKSDGAKSASSNSSAPDPAKPDSSKRSDKKEATKQSNNSGSDKGVSTSATQSKESVSSVAT